MAVNIRRHVSSGMMLVTHAQSLIAIYFQNKWKRKGSDSIARATSHCLFTGAIPVLPNVEDFACCLSTLGRFSSP